MPGLPKVLKNDNGIRPAGRPTRCFYCDQEVGQEHLSTCVTLTKRVRIRVTVEYETEVPMFWTPDDVEFHLNDSSSCANNALYDLIAFYEERDDCACNSAEFEFVSVVDPGPHIELRESELN